MTIYAETERHESPDGGSAVTIERGDHGLWRYVQWEWKHPDPDLPDITEFSWYPTHWSGLFANADEVRAAAIAETAWLRVL